MTRVLVRLLESRAGRWAGRSLAVVEYEGRRSGRRIRLVTTYARDGDVVRIPVGLPDRKTLWRNFQDGHPVRLLLRGQTYEATGRVVDVGGRVHVLAQLTAPS